MRFITICVAVLFTTKLLAGVQEIKLPKKNFKAISPKVNIKSLKKTSIKRSISSLALSNSELEAMISPDLKKFMSEINSIKNDQTSPDQLEKIISKYNNNYNNLSADLKFIIAQTYPIVTFRGVMWRLIPLVGGGIPGVVKRGKKFRGMHATLLTQVRTLYSLTRNLVINPLGKASLKYISYPFSVKKGDKWKVVDYYQFGDKGIAQLQNDMTSTLLPLLEQAADRLANLNDLKGNDQNVFDNKLVFGKLSFPDSNPARFVRYGEPERTAIVANYYAAIADLSRLLAFDWRGSLKVTNQMGKELGFKQLGLASGSSNGILPAEVHNSINKQKILGNKTSNTDELLQKSYEYLEKSIEWGKIAKSNLEYMRSVPSTNVFIDGTMITPTANNLIQINFDAVEMLFGNNNCEEGKGRLIKNQLTSETVCVNFKAMYYSPPQSLKELLPTKYYGYKYNQDKKKYSKNSDYEGYDKIPLLVHSKDGELVEKKISYRSYKLGLAEDWNLQDSSFYARIFPSIPKAKDKAKELRKSVRAVNQAWGTGPMAIGLFPFIN